MSIQPNFSFNIDGRSVGAILDVSTGSRIGSGFIVDDPSIVITARHVGIDDRTNQRRELAYESPRLPISPPPIVPVPAKLKLLREFPALDIAVMRIEGGTPCERSLKRSTVAVKVGEWVAYAGLDPSSGFKVSSHEILTIKATVGATYFQILGDARPGYSGGPVFDQQGGVVGVILRGLPNPAGGSLFDALAMSSIPVDITLTNP